MRMAFLLALLAGGIFYSYIAFVDLRFLSNTGRLGPGFFPRVIGVVAVVMILWALIEDMTRRRGGNEEAAGRWRDLALLVALALGYAVLLPLFGGFVATLIYLAIALSFLNPGDLLRNMIIAILAPSGVYLLFDKLLNASMPPAMFALPL